MNLYSKIRKVLSKKNQGKLSSFLIKFGIKPSVNTRVKSTFNTGIAVFSADFEMAWAFRYSKPKRTSSKNGIKGKEPFQRFLVYLTPIKSLLPGQR